MHGIGGLVGNILTAFFADRSIAALDGSEPIPGGWLNHHWIQAAYQLADSFSGGLYSFTATCIILFVLNLIPGLRIRTDEDAEVLGMDDAEIGEFAYDYVELTREVLNDVGDEARYSAEMRPYPQASTTGHEKAQVPVGFDPMVHQYRMQ